MAFYSERIGLADPDRRASLFRETARDRLERWAFGLAWSLMPQRIGGLPNLARLWLSGLAKPAGPLPDPEAALDEPYGLAGFAHDLSVPTLLAAHRHGLYPFAHIGPVKWWSPPMRSLLFFGQTHISKRLRRQMRQGHYRVTFDRDFDGVIKACAGQRAGRFHVTWITPKIMRAYAALHDEGYAHSFEVWNDKGELAGGGYGVAVGNSFVTESQFSREDNTSKIGFTVLNYHLAKWDFAFNDGKMLTPTTRDQGFHEIPRADYLTRLATAADQPDRRGRWQAEFDLHEISQWQPSEMGGATKAE